MNASTILIVDDNPFVLTTIDHILAPQFRVLAARSGKRALYVAARGPNPDLILLDVNMPDMDGYTVLSKLREDPVTKYIPVIFVTGLETAEDEEKGLSLGAVDYITKPVNPAILLSRVSTHLTLQHARMFLRDKNDYLESEIARRVKENRDLSDLLFTAHEDERRHLARELHDDFGQLLASLKLTIESIDQDSSKLEPDVVKAFLTVDRLVDEAVQRIREITHELWPTLLEHLGLVDALEELFSEWKLRQRKMEGRFSCEGTFDYLDENVSLTFYRIVQECLTNITKHAQATYTSVILKQEGDLLKLEITDNGKGFDVSKTKYGIGLPGMQKRIESLGGNFTLAKNNKKGVTIIISILLANLHEPIS